MFKLPEITYPLSIGTLGMTMVTGHEITLYCNARGCEHRQRLNLVKLSKRLGMDHSTLHVDLAPHLWCVKCDKAGRPSDQFTLILTPATSKSRWPREERRAVRRG